jgi:hypothetical protein
LSEEKSKSGAARKRSSEGSDGKAPTAAERAAARAEARKAAREKEAAKAKPAAPKAGKPRPKPKSPAKAKPKERMRTQRKPEAPADGPGAARLFALLAGGFLALLGVVGFVYDASWGTGNDLSSDDVLGTLMVNGWRNVVYLVTGLAALALAPRRPRETALGLGSLYLVYAIWGFIVTERGIGDILGVLPLGDWDNGLHLAIGLLGLLAAFVDGPLPQVPERLRPKLPKPRRTKEKPKQSGASGRSRLPRPDFSKNRTKPRSARQPARSGPGSPRRGREAPRRDGDDEPR